VTVRFEDACDPPHGTRRVVVRDPAVDQFCHPPDHRSLVLGVRSEHLHRNRLSAVGVAGLVNESETERRLAGVSAEPRLEVLRGTYRKRLVEAFLVTGLKPEEKLQQREQVVPVELPLLADTDDAQAAAEERAQIVVRLLRGPATETGHVVHDDHIDPARTDVGEQAAVPGPVDVLERRDADVLIPLDVLWRQPPRRQPRPAVLPLRLGARLTPARPPFGLSRVDAHVVSHVTNYRRSSHDMESTEPLE
jgi:hypothetical protein